LDGADMVKAVIDPGVCGFITKVEAVSEDGMEVKVKVRSGCKSVMGMIEAYDGTFNSFEVCLVRPGKGPLYEYASENFPYHCACSTISGITKAIEVECKLALPRDASFKFVEDTADQAE